MKRTICFPVIVILLLWMTCLCALTPKATEQLYDNSIYSNRSSTTIPYLQQLPEDITGCSNLYNILTPVNGYYTATQYDTTNGAVLSVVIPVEPGDRIAASSFGPVSENMGSVNGIRVTYLLNGVIIKSLSANSVYTTYISDGFLTVPEGVNMVSVPWWVPSTGNWLTLSQKSKNFTVHDPIAVSAQAPTCTESGYTAGEICKICNASLGTRVDIPATGHCYSGNTCTICGTVNALAFLDGKYVSILGDSISTFNGYSNDATVNSTIGGNGHRYDAGAADTKPGSYCLLESVDHTWWMHFANRSGMKLLVNNSWAGSQVFGNQTSDGRLIPAAYLDRCINLHDNTVENNPGNTPIHPDVIFVYLGINDYNFNRNNVGKGAVDYANLISSDGSYVTPTTFGEAYGILLHKMQNAYPDAQIFAMTLLPENLYSVDMAAWAEHNAYIRAAAEFYNVPVVDLAENCAITWENYSGYMIDKIHPTTAGMELISNCIEEELFAYYSENPPHIHTPVIDAAVDASCTKTGLTEGSHCSACGEVFLAQEIIPALDHCYQTATVDPTYTEAGSTTHTCSACGDSYSEDIPILDNPMQSYSITLSDSIGVNFVISLNEGDIVAVTVANKAVDVQVIDSKFSVELAAAQMKDEIVVTINSLPLTNTYSVRGYAEYILDEENGYDEPTKNLVKAMLNYGTASQLYFNYNTENPANSGISFTAKDVPSEDGSVELEGSVEGISFYGASLMHRNKIAVRFYFTGSIDGLTFKVGETEYMPLEKNSMYYLEAVDINPQDLEENINITVSDGKNILRIAYSPMDYIIRMNSKVNSTDAMKYLVQALYAYWMAAEMLIA